MIRTIKRKFIFTAMLAITLMIVILLGVINVVNIVSSNSQINNMMEALVYTHGEIFEGFKGVDPSGFIEYFVTPAEIGESSGDEETAGDGGSAAEGELPGEADLSSGGGDSDTSNQSNDEVRADSENSPISGRINPNIIYIFDGERSDSDGANSAPDSSVAGENSVSASSDELGADSVEALGDELSDNSAEASGSPRNAAESYAGPYSGFIMTPITENVYESAVYFIIVMDSEGSLISADISNVSSEDEKSAYELALEMYTAGKSSGRTGSYRFASYSRDSLNSPGIQIIIEEEEVTYSESSENVGDNLTLPGGRIVYIFLDTSTEYYGVLRVLLMSVIAGAAVWILMLLLVILLSNKMIRPVAENYELQKNFITDAGHEIKTPLAIIQANAEALELYNGENKWTENIKNQTIRLSALMTNLLTLAKAEEANPGNSSGRDILHAFRRKKTKRGSHENHTGANACLAEEGNNGGNEDKYGENNIVNLTGILRNQIDMFEESSALRNLSFADNVSDDVTAKGSEAQFSELFSILLDNAVKYAAPGTKIVIDLYLDVRTAFFRIKNTCEELPSCEPERLFERFYRPDASRSSDTGGNGIGLAAARAVCETLGGSISAAYEGSDIIFTVRI